MPFGQLLLCKSYLTGVNKLYSLRSLIYKQKAPNALKTIYNKKLFFANKKNCQKDLIIIDALPKEDKDYKTPRLPFQSIFLDEYFREQQSAEK